MLFCLVSCVNSENLYIYIVLNYIIYIFIYNIFIKNKYIQDTRQITLNFSVYNTLGMSCICPLTCCKLDNYSNTKILSPSILFFPCSTLAKCYFIKYSNVTLLLYKLTLKLHAQNINFKGFECICNFVTLRF